MKMITNNILSTAFELSISIKKDTERLHTLFATPCNDSVPEVLARMEEESEALYDKLGKLICDFDHSCYKCSANHVLGHYIKAYYLMEAGVKMVQTMKMLWKANPFDYTSLVLLLRGEMELISFVLRYLENAVREYRCA